jgi:acyl-CoA synthetase (NDP forming)
VLLARFPDPPQKGLGVISFSGAFCAFAHDHCERLALELPRLSPATEAKLSHSLPEFVPAQNPLDLGTQPFWQPELCRIAAEALTDDSAIGSILVALNGLTPQWSEAFVEALKDQRKPVVISVPNTPVAPEIEAAFRRHNIALMRSHERSLAAISRVTAHGRSLMRRRPVHADEHKPTRFAPAEFGAGPLPEWKGKELLRGLGFQVPDGKLVGTFEDAETFFNAVRRPVALKAQSATLPHKSEVGGVILALSDRPSLREGWNRLHENLATFAPEAVLDGVLIEAMAPSGIEFILGARREPRWGPVLSIGLGGVWAEALRDVKLMPCDLTPDEIAAELAPLRCAPLLSGFRGGPPADVTALSGAASILGALMLERPEIAEIDINPLIVHPDGQGVTVADVLIVSYPAG